METGDGGWDPTHVAEAAITAAGVTYTIRMERHYEFTRRDIAELFAVLGEQAGKAGA